MRVLLSAYTGLGNFILKTPLIRTIREQHRDVQIDIIYGSPWGIENVLKNSDLVDQQISVPDSIGFIKQLILFRKRVEVRSYDLILLPFDSTPPYLYVSLLRSKNAKIIAHLRRVSGLRNILQKMAFILMPHIKWITVLKNRHEIDLNLDLLMEYETQPFDYSRETVVCWKKTGIVADKLHKPYIVLQAGANNGAATPKTWSPSNFVGFVNMWRADYPECEFVLVGDKGDECYLKHSSLLNQDGVVNLLGKTSFDELCDVLMESRLVISHDSGVMHIANALSVPLIALYGPTDYTRTRPLANSSSLLISEKCKESMYGFQLTEKYLSKKYEEYYCLSGISVPSLYAAANKIIGKIHD